MGSSNSNLKKSQENLYVNPKYVIEKYTNEYLDIKGKFQSLQGINNQGSQILKNLYDNLIIRALIIVQSNFCEINNDNFDEKKEKIMKIMNGVLDNYKISTTNTNTTQPNLYAFESTKSKYSSIKVNYDNYITININTYKYSINDLLRFLEKKINKLKNDVDAERTKCQKAQNSTLEWIKFKFSGTFHLFNNIKNIEEGHSVFISNIIEPLKNNINVKINNFESTKVLISDLTTELDTLSVENFNIRKDSISQKIGQIRDDLDTI